MPSALPSLVLKAPKKPWRRCWHRRSLEAFYRFQALSRYSIRMCMVYILLCLWCSNKIVGLLESGASTPYSSHGIFALFGLQPEDMESCKQACGSMSLIVDYGTIGRVAFTTKVSDKSNDQQHQVTISSPNLVSSAVSWDKFVQCSKALLLPCLASDSQSPEC